MRHRTTVRYQVRRLSTPHGPSTGPGRLEASLRAHQGHEQTDCTPHGALREILGVAAVSTTVLAGTTT